MTRPLLPETGERSPHPENTGESRPRAALHLPGPATCSPDRVGDMAGRLAMVALPWPLGAPGSDGDPNGGERGGRGAGGRDTIRPRSSAGRSWHHCGHPQTCRRRRRAAAPGPEDRAVGDGGPRGDAIGSFGKTGRGGRGRLPASAGATQLSQSAPEAKRALPSGDGRLGPAVRVRQGSRVSAPAARRRAGAQDTRSARGHLRPGAEAPSGHRSPAGPHKGRPGDPPSPWVGGRPGSARPDSAGSAGARHRDAASQAGELGARPETPETGGPTASPRSHQGSGLLRHRPGGRHLGLPPGLYGQRAGPKSSESEPSG